MREYNPKNNGFKGKFRRGLAGLLAVTGIGVGSAALSSCDNPLNVNEAPVASYTINPSEKGYTEIETTFDASASSDSDGDIASYSWDFDGDGATDTTTTSATTTHVYETPGTYNTGLTITDNSGDTGTSNLEYGVERPEQVAYMFQDRSDSDNWVDRIAITSFAINEGDVEVLERRVLTEGTKDNWHPTWSPDGNWIYSTSTNEEGKYAVFKMDTNGENVTDVSSHLVERARQPDVCSVDGKVAISYYEGNEAGIAYISQDETNLTKVVVEESEGDFIRPPEHPSWSEDCSNITYSTHKDGNWEIYAADLNEGTEINVTNNSARDQQPIFLPDGRILFFSDRENPNQNPMELDFYIVEKNGNNLQRITFAEGRELDSSVSPNGEYMAFSHSVGSNLQVHVSNFNEAGNEENWTQLTFGNNYNRSPAWRPHPQDE